MTLPVTLIVRLMPASALQTGRLPVKDTGRVARAATDRTKHNYVQLLYNYYYYY